MKEKHGMRWTHINIPVIGAGELENIEIASDMVEKEEVDFIALARKIMNQPNYVEGLLKKIKRTDC
ncbi:hypothetical protein ACSU64_20465 [Bacillaceae bacterium C204]|uniref:hypothetical protein n=1 Tax=Neobacillus sp. 204 TaxID=3383351 RepID=UPI00397B2666